MMPWRIATALCFGLAWMGWQMWWFTKNDMEYIIGTYAFTLTVDKQIMEDLINQDRLKVWDHKWHSGRRG